MEAGDSQAMIMTRNEVRHTDLAGSKDSVYRKTSLSSRYHLVRRRGPLPSTLLRSALCFQTLPRPKRPDAPLEGSPRSVDAGCSREKDRLEAEGWPQRPELARIRLK